MSPKVNIYKKDHRKLTILKVLQEKQLKDTTLGGVVNFLIEYYEKEQGEIPTSLAELRKQKTD
ncbi:MAG: hypothetical protein ACE5OZ_25990 [Candidatus Heimdallarchaeota archaeon]